jgi:hypothetical protein
MLYWDVLASRTRDTETSVKAVAVLDHHLSLRKVVEHVLNGSPHGHSEPLLHLLQPGVVRNGAPSSDAKLDSPHWVGAIDIVTGQTRVGIGNDLSLAATGRVASTWMDKARER